MPSEPFHRLFFAVRPPREQLPDIADLRDAFGRPTGLVSDARLHLTTFLFPDHKLLPPDLVARASAAAASIPRSAFGIVLDHMQGGGGSVRLIGAEGVPAGYAAFQHGLAAALRARGLAPRARWRFAPHMTLLYGDHDVDRSILPIGWRAREFVLIDSHVGQGRHEVVGRWALA